MRGLRIGVPRGYFFDHLEDDIAAAMAAAIDVLVQLGAEVRDVEIPGVAEGLGGTFGFVLAEAQDIHAASLRDRPEDFGPDVHEILTQLLPERY